MPERIPLRRHRKGEEFACSPHTLPLNGPRHLGGTSYALLQSLRSGPCQFLAFISEYMMRNEAGVAPTCADLQRFLNLTAPSVSSTRTRLEQRGFNRRIPGRARGIQLTVKPECIPSLDRPFKL